MFSRVKSGVVFGLKCFLIDVEVDVSNGLPCFVMVGKLKSEVKECAERVRIALKNIKISIPPMHVAVNLSPADIMKSGTGFDLPVALGLLQVTGHIPLTALDGMMVLGELGLNGEVKRVDGVMPMVWEGRKNGITQCIVPFDNASEAALVDGMKVIGIHDVLEAVDYLNASEEERDILIPPAEYLGETGIIDAQLDFADVVGQEGIKRGALIAAAGMHHMLITGPPGTGKTMIARRIPTIMPPLSLEESMDITSIYSIAGRLSASEPIISKRPFVDPHHTISQQGMSGGGSVPKPGAVSLAHKGILFLDELPEFRRESLDILRQPLEEKSINISRAIGSFSYPADIMLVAAMNPCPCGYYPDMNKCNCPPLSIRHYLSHISGPLLDRIDICLTAQKVKISELNSNIDSIRKTTMSSKDMQKLVINAREIQKDRYSNERYDTNSSLDASGIKRYIKLGSKEKRFIEDMCNKLDVSARSFHRLLKVARTIADIEGDEDIKIEHLTEAVCYRPQLPKM